MAAQQSLHPLRPPPRDLHVPFAATSCSPQNAAKPALPLRIQLLQELPNALLHLIHPLRDLILVTKAALSLRLWSLTRLSSVRRLLLRRPIQLVVHFTAVGALRIVLPWSWLRLLGGVGVVAVAGDLRGLLLR